MGQLYFSASVVARNLAPRNNRGGEIAAHLSGARNDKKGGARNDRKGKVARNDDGVRAMTKDMVF